MNMQKVCVYIYLYLYTLVTTHNSNKQLVTRDVRIIMSNVWLSKN